jgi:putative ABC transport system permease protein
MAIIQLALKSLWNRKLTFFITLFSIAISVTLLLGVQTLKNETKTSFMKSISGTDLIIGARGASSQLLLSSVFHIGNSENTIKYASYLTMSESPVVEWAVPISLGDSHKGYTVMATALNFFEHFSYADQQHLTVQKGKIIDDMFAVVIGADVAEKLNYTLGQRIVMTHGGGEIGGHGHDNIPYFISAILAPSFTAIDQTLIISLEAMEAMHTDNHGHFGALPNETTINSEIDPEGHEHHHEAHEDKHEGHEHHDDHDAHESHEDHQDTAEQRVARLLKLKPQNINAVFVGLTSPQAILGMQNYVNNYQDEPLTAIIPALALQTLWQFFSVAEVALNIVTVFVVLVGLLGMLSIILMSLNERRREMAILRSVGARPGHIFALIIGEAAAVCFSGIVAGVMLLYVLLFVLQAPLAQYFGFYLDINMLTSNDLLMLAVIQLCALTIAIIPGLLIYKTSLSDGMSIKF